MADIVQDSVVDGLSDVSHRPLHVGWCDDLMSPRRVFIRGQDPNLPPGYLLFMDVHRLWNSDDKEGNVSKRNNKKIQMGSSTWTSDSMNWS